MPVRGFSKDKVLRRERLIEGAWKEGGNRPFAEYGPLCVHPSPSARGGGGGVGIPRAEPMDLRSLSPSPVSKTPQKPKVSIKIPRSFSLTAVMVL